MVAIVLDCRNLFEILRSIDMLRAMYMVAFCLGLRMHEGQNRVPGSIQKSAKLGYMTAICAWLTMHLATIACRVLMLWGCRIY